LALTGKYTNKFLKLVQNNSGILTWDNYCHVYGSPTPTINPINYKTANYTVVAISEYQFIERPKFRWRYLDNIDTVVTSIPLDPLDLLPVKDLVSFFFFSLIFFKLHLFRSLKMFWLLSRQEVLNLKVEATLFWRTLLVESYSLTLFPKL